MLVAKDRLTGWLPLQEKSGLCQRRQWPALRAARCWSPLHTVLDAYADAQSSIKRYIVLFGGDTWRR